MIPRWETFFLVFLFFFETDLSMCEPAVHGGLMNKTPTRTLALVAFPRRLPLRLRIRLFFFWIRLVSAPRLLHGGGQFQRRVSCRLLDAKAWKKKRKEKGKDINIKTTPYGMCKTPRCGIDGQASGKCVFLFF